MTQDKRPRGTGGLKTRALRGTLVSLSVAGGGHVLRFLSNLVLTRLLFPEAFGLMTLVQVIIMGLSLLSNFGVRISIMQNPRGEDPIFLDTAWTLQAIRGVLLWLAICLLAYPMGRFYDQPMLTGILPVAGLQLVVQGFFTTKTMIVQRNMQLGRYSTLTLLSQFVNLILMAVLAYLLRSVWALVIGGVIGSVLLAILYQRFLPGHTNRFRIERESVREILKLGKFLFFSTIATYVISQSDRAFLGAAIPIDLLGVYGVSYALATLPTTLSSTVANQVVFPLYRMRHPLDEAGNRPQILRARRLVAGATLVLTTVMAFVAPPLIELLYDQRYILAGPITILLCTANVGIIVLNGTMNAALAKGDSYRFMMMNILTAVTQTVLMYIGVRTFGIIGAAVAIGAAPLLTYPVLAIYLRRYNNWDVVGDVLLMTAGFTATGLAIGLHQDQIFQLLSH